MIWCRTRSSSSGALKLTGEEIIGALGRRIHAGAVWHCITTWVDENRFGGGGIVGAPFPDPPPFSSRDGTADGPPGEV